MAPSGRMKYETPKVGRQQKRGRLVGAGEKDLRDRHGEISVDQDIEPLEGIADGCGGDHAECGGPGLGDPGMSRRGSRHVSHPPAAKRPNCRSAA